MIEIKSRLNNYFVNFGKTKEFLLEIDKKYTNFFYVIDKNVWDIYNKSSLISLKDKEIMILEIDEERKNLNVVQEVYDSLIECSSKRNTTMVSIGGGIIQDITGFAASTIYRGIKWIFIPTTLLAQADSCIGAKTSLNYKGFKNLIGTFFPPKEIYIDTDFIISQKDVDFFSGLGEIVKLHIMDGENSTQKIIELLPELLNKDTKFLMESIKKSLLIKKGYIEEDEFDTGRRNLLNFGHCFGHALESTSNFEIPHGQAVIIGIIFANIVAKKRGLLSESIEQYIFQKLLLPLLVVKLQKQYFDVEKVVSVMKKDKKRIGENMALIMLINDWKTIRVNDLKINEIESALNVLEHMLI